MRIFKIRIASFR